MRLQGIWNQDLIQPQQFALQRLPDATVTGRQELFNNLMFADYDAEAVDFYRYEGIDGLRLDANPRVTLPWRWGDYVYGYGEIGSQAAFYDTTGHNIRSFQSEPHPQVSPAPHLRNGGGTEAIWNNCACAEPLHRPRNKRTNHPICKSRNLNGPRSRLRRRMEVDREAQKYNRTVCQLLLCAEHLPGQHAPVRFVRSSELSQPVQLWVHHAPVRQDQQFASRGDDNRRDSDRRIIRCRFGRRAVKRRTHQPGFVGAARAEISSETASIPRKLVR